MGVKTKLGLGVASAALGLALIGGGTFAYFSSSKTVTGNFVNGTLDLNASPDPFVNISANFKPGDWANRTITLENSGSLDIARILLKTTYQVTDANNNNGQQDLSNSIRVIFLKDDVGTAKVDPTNQTDSQKVYFSTTLKELENMNSGDLETNVFNPILSNIQGLKGDNKNELKLYVQLQFIDNNQDQNVFQGDSVQLTWTFEGRQGAGQHQ